MRKPKAIDRARPCACGSRRLAVRDERIAEDAMSSFVVCRSCGATGDATDDAYSDREGAVDLWNRMRRMPATGMVDQPAA